MTKDQTYFAGVDGGATKTVCIISDGRGLLKGFGMAGSSNCHNVGLSVALTEIRKAVRRARKDAKIGRSELASICFGLAGVDSPLDSKRIGRGLRSLKLARRQVVVHDTTVALSGALAGDSGVIVIAGTGSVAGGIDSGGRTVRVGGWGAILDDEGSAYDIGRRALTASLRSYDGRGKPTALLKATMKRVGAKIPEGIIEAVYIKGMSVAEIASLTPVVVELASRGDGVSREILESTGESLADLALATANKLRLKGRFKISPVGGVFKSGGLVIDAFRNRLRRTAPHARIVSPRFGPAVGSLILALQACDVELSLPVLSRLSRRLKSY